MHDAGSISGANLAAVLTLNAYEELNKSCIWKSTKPGEETMMFQINVDDFAIIYDPTSGDLSRLKSVLDSVGYGFTIEDTNNTSVDFCGIQITHDIKTHAVSKSMQQYRKRKLKEFGFEHCIPEEHPYKHTDKDFKKAGKQTATPEDDSPKATTAQLAEIQAKLGSLRWLIDCVMPELKLALERLAARLGNPTIQLLEAIDHLWRYIAHPDRANPCIVYTPQIMQLGVFSDASFSSESRSRSRAGGIIFVGELNQENTPVSSPIAVVSEVIKGVCDSAAEAEYMAVHSIMKAAVPIKYLLEDMGYKQNPVIHRCDNQCAVGLANNTVNDKRTKHIHRKVHWVQDQVAQSIFKVIWEKGTTNCADYMTKEMNTESHRKMIDIFGRQCDIHGIALPKSQLAKSSTKAEGVLGDSDRIE